MLGSPDHAILAAGQPQARMCYNFDKRDT